ncbi:MAG TPA: YlxR family protein [Jatrophihabitans sp.]|uniref:YlxR family protein n=1 Tax=Jatrophihabitans sp. TaxID=1932789 RepID=UPI002EF878B8
MGSRVVSGRLSDGGQLDDARVLRTCIGCRQRTSATELLRVVAGPAASTEAGDSSSPPGTSAQVLPDPRRRAAGRGAWLHPVIGCMELAERRRAFGRALRSTAQLDATPVRKYVESITGS